MRLTKISYTRQSVSNSIELSSRQRDYESNYISVLSGENGVGKSTLLRIISDFSLGRRTSRLPGGGVEKLWGVVTGGIVKRTIALSGTINDRFPNNASSDLRLTVNSFDLEEFYYFGPRYSGGIASHSRASNNITRGILDNIVEKWAPSDSLSSLLAYMGFHSQLDINLSVGSRHKKDKWRSLNTLFHRTAESTSRSTGVPTAMRNAANVLQYVVTQRMDVATDSGGPSVARITANIQTGTIELKQNFCSEAYIIGAALGLSFNQVISAYISLGILDAKVVLLSKEVGKPVSLDDMSSGQWQLINCMFNLGILVEDNTLVLVDEPENSLHPQWQRDYIKTLRKIISHRSGCHVVLATHAPLIVSSVLPSDGEILSLREQEGSGGIVAINEGMAYGWTSGDVLENILHVESERPPELSNAINSALGILKDRSSDSSQLKSIARRISLLSRHLPPQDPLRDVVDIVISASAKRTDSSKRE